MTRTTAYEALRRLEITPTPMMSLAEGRLMLVFVQIPMSHAEQSVVAASVTGAIAMAMNDRMSDPSVQGSIHELDRTVGLLRAAADLFEAIYLASKN